ncbi:MotA/TolQ/ExbB proton channel family protein [Cerasicoccus arenae]|uniref:Biopolymer transporter ExbB n=1 Tax=Cerasicoccus arenae TaxID=424488 RepID=A0A8J3GEA5_9BACT|nr:MotA/TolQ/ExbB proton channel family protein [Cerasicoccus arenae]MBK1858256.1 MotA/TolQ/ExbB proton channel family protein [Cerasicoccus arenae]GHC02208.1 biopolymer transporter ExbB [Cerasicoccus arenae]
MKRIHAFTVTFGLVGLLSAPLIAQDINVDERLEDALKQLDVVNQEIRNEKIPLSKAVSEIETKVVRLEREYDNLLKQRDSRTIDLNSLERQVKQMKDQADFVQNRLNEFISEFEGRINISELPAYAELISAAELAPTNVNLSPEQKRALQFDVIEAAMTRVENLIGGYAYEGAALSPDMELVDGKFAFMGPSVFFSSNDGQVYGLVETQLNAADPVVVDLPDSVDQGISKAIQTGAGNMPFDSTLGKAIKVAKAEKHLMAYVEDGGEVGYVIIGLGFIACFLALFKCAEIFSFKVAMPKHIDAILDDVDKGDMKAAQDKANSIGGAAGEMLAAGVVNSEEKRGILEEMMFERILKARPYLERFLPFLAITAAAAPLLGLLGTVIGMIKTFQLITIFGTGDAKSLSTGISEALVTTALGLIVAIPVLILHGMLSRMAKRKLGLLEQGAVAFVNGVMSRRHDNKGGSESTH